MNRTIARTRLSAQTDTMNTTDPSGQIQSKRPRLLLIMLVLALGLAAWRLLGPALKEKQLAAAGLFDLQRLATGSGANERVLYYLGRKQETVGDKHAAMDSYWRALQIDQQDEAAWLGWARTTDAVLGPDKARQVIQTCLQALPNSAPIYVQLARIEQRAGNHEGALAAAEKAARLDPRNLGAWQIAGAEAAAMQRHAEARRTFAQAASLSPGDWRSWAGLGDALSHLCRRKEAAAAFREAVRLAPNEGVTRLLLGTELLLAAASDKDIETARGELLEADRLSASLPPAAQFQNALMLGDSFRRERRWSQALEWYIKAQALSPFDPTVQYGLARSYRGMGNIAVARRAEARHEALSRLDREINELALRVDIAPDDSAARLRLARLYASVGQSENAALNYRKLSNSGPSAGLARRELRSLLSRSANTAGLPPALRP